MPHTTKESEPKKLPDPEVVHGRDLTPSELESTLIHQTERRRTGDVYEPNLIGLLIEADKIISEHDKNNKNTEEDKEET